MESPQRKLRLADVRRWMVLLEGIATSVRSGKNAGHKAAKLHALLGDALGEGQSRAFESSPRAPPWRAQCAADARVAARQRVIIELVDAVDRVVRAHVVLAGDRLHARNDLFELLFDASDLGVEECAQVIGQHQRDRVGAGS